MSNRVAGVLFLVCALLFSTLAGVRMVALDRGFYLSQFVEEQVDQSSGASLEDLMRASDALIDYISGKTDQLSVLIAVDGVQRSAFYEDEILHMEDVRGLFDLAHRLMLLFGAAALVFLLFQALRPSSRGAIAQTHAGIGIGWGILGTGILALYLGMRHRFDSLFVRFHLLLFDNDLWMMNPASQFMIRMFSQNFFFQAAKRVLGIGIALCLLLWGLMHLGMRLTPRLGQKK